MLSDAAGEVQRGLEVVEFACGIPQLLKGEHSEQVSRGVDAYSLRQPLGVVAGITPFNFPVMVPMWMFPIAIADREHVRPQAFRARPVGFGPAGRAVPGGRAARRRAERPAGRRLRGERAARPPGRRRRRRSSARRRSRSTSTRAARRRASACRRWAAPRTTWSCCRTPTSTWPPTPLFPLATARPVSAAWRSRWSSRSARRATSWSRRSPRGPASCTRRCCPAPTPTPRWARWSPACTGTR